MEVVNQLGKFTPHIAELSQLLRELLTKNCICTWGPRQAKAFQTIKENLAQPQVLASYDSNAETKVSADAYGLGTVLLQKNHNQQWTPVAYASRSLTDTQTRYTQIEKEALAATWFANASLTISWRSRLQ